MNTFSANIFNEGKKSYVKIDFDIDSIWKLKMPIKVRGSLSSETTKITFTDTKLISKGNGIYYLVIRKGDLAKLNNPSSLTVAIEPVIQNNEVKHNQIDFMTLSSLEIKTNEHLYNEEEQYKQIFVRKSFHVFKQKYLLTVSDIEKIKELIGTVKPLFPNIKTKIVIEPRENTSATRGEYALMLFSEKDPHFLENIGYIGEQLDLLLTKLNIGTCWYGLGRTKTKKLDGLDFVIMLLIEKVDATDFRVDFTKTVRNEISEFWHTNQYLELAKIVRYCPSACNSQPWDITEEKKGLVLSRKKRKKGIMPDNRIYYFNRIDLGIFILFLELTANHYNEMILFDFFPENKEDYEKIAYLRIEKK